MKRSVVIGGGIAGIVAAYRLAALGKKVILVERDQSLGGLLQSRCINGKFYDFGTHLLSMTGISELDNFLFAGLSTVDLSTSSVASFNRTLHVGSTFPHDFGFSDHDRSLFLNSYLQLDKTVAPPNTFPNLAEQLTFTYGTLIYNQLLAPTLHKFFHESPTNLAPDSHRLFGLNRIILGDSDTTRELKKNELYDNDLAFHAHQDGLKPDLSLFYPLNGGVGAWPKLLLEKLKVLDVEVVTNAQYTLTCMNDEITQIDLCGKTYDTDLVVSTIPLGALLKTLCPSHLPSGVTRTCLSTVLVHLDYPSDYLCDSLYVYNHDPCHRAFRVSLYGNYHHSVPSRSNHLTVEFLVPTTP